MTPKEKQIISIVAAVAILLGGYVWASKYRNSPEPAPQGQNQPVARGGDADWNNFQNEEFSFEYPAKLTLSERDQQVVLSHSISYQNHGGCDMDGSEAVYPTLTDFNVSFGVINKPFVDSVREKSPYIPEENFSGDDLKISPGFIDEYQLGTKKGVSIYEGVEGCGRITYYVPVNSGKTLIMQKSLVQALSPVIVKEKRDEVLRVPGVITPEDSNAYFTLITSSLKFTE